LMLVEHDMDVLFQLAHRITVLVKGSVLASGTPEAIRADASVLIAYLGQED
ncbi:MAG: ABC transporter ATP-binding protein, partial [Pseudolabrys sp.]